MGSPAFRPSPPGVMAAVPPRRQRKRLLILLVVIAVLSLVVAFSLALAFSLLRHPSTVAQPCRSLSKFSVDGPSMEPGLHAGDGVQVEGLACVPRGPARGDVIVFHYPKDPTQDFIKRVIGLPGDTLVITNTSVMVDGVLLKEPYISQPVNTSIINFKLPTNEYWVMGDNRPFSSDSRAWGPVPFSYIIGKVTKVLTPPGDAGAISSYPEVFAGLPTP